MYRNSIFIFFYCGGITPLEGIELDGIQDQKKDNAGHKETFILGERHGHLTTNPIREECAHTNGHHQ
jgi:hypothetical protein